MTLLTDSQGTLSRKINDSARTGSADGAFINLQAVLYGHVRPKKIYLSTEITERLQECLNKIVNSNLVKVATHVEGHEAVATSRFGTRKFVGGRSQSNYPQMRRHGLGRRPNGPEALYKSFDTNLIAKALRTRTFRQRRVNPKKGRGSYSRAKERRSL